MILPALPFRLERDMLDPLARSLTAHLAAGTGDVTRILREPQIGNVIPDLLVGIQVEGLPPVRYLGATRIDAHVRALLQRDGPLAPHAITERLHLAPATADASLRRLTRAGVIAPIEVGAHAQLMLTPFANGSDLELFAVEAKLARWQTAIEQAAAYRSFAEYSVVVLDGNRVRLTAAMHDAAIATGVGIMFQHGRVLRPAVSPRYQAPAPCADRVIALAKLTDSRSSRALAHA